MSIDIGIIGLPRSGKTTVFNALTSGAAVAPGSTAGGQGPHIGVVKVPEPRLWVLNEMFHPRKVVPAEAKYLDIGASVKGMAQDKGIGGQLLNQLSNVDTLISVIQAFDNGDIRRDIAAMNLEMAFSDLAIIERRLERIENSLKGAKPAERQGLARETEILKEFQSHLEKDRPVREMAPDAAAAKYISNFQFLTAKPLLIMLNIGEDRLPEAASLEAELNKEYHGERCRVVALCGKLEMELAQMEDDEAAVFREDYGLKESGLDRAIKLSYEISEMISFFTVGEDEVRAWPIKTGTTALKAAGKIHTDIEKGFIRAENVAYEDLIRCGGLPEARKQGLLRLEGKEYIVQDGDVINFLFNV